MGEKFVKSMGENVVKRMGETLQKVYGCKRWVKTL